MAGRFSIEATFRGNDRLTGVVSKIEGRVGRFGSGLSAGLRSVDAATSKAASGLLNVVKNAALAGAALAAAAAPLAAYNIAKTGADFEQAITNVGAVSLSTRDQIQDLEKTALDLGLKTKFTATQAANAMETMARAGFKNSEVLAGIPGLLAAAAAEGITPGEVTEVVAATIKGMGLAASETSRVADVFALASARTKSSILSLGESMATVGPVASQLGVSLEDATASVALLQDAGLDASVAGSAVSTMLTKLAKATPQVAAQMAAFGIKFQDAHGDMLPFREVLQNISQGAKKSGGNLQQMGFFSELAGMRGQKAALGLAKALQSGRFDELSAELKNAAGSAEKMAGIRINTLEGDLTLLGSSIDIVKIALFNTQSGPLRQIVQRTNEWVIANKDLIASGFQGFVEKAKWGVELFGRGAKEGFGAAKAGIDLFLVPLQKLIGLREFKTWPDNVLSLGRAFGFLAGVTATFLLFAGAVKVARGVVLAYEGAVLAAKAAVWLWSAAQGAYALATDGALAATVLNTAATWAGRAATVASNAVTWIAFAATTRFTFAQVASKVASYAAAAATWAWNLAQGAWTGVTTLATGALAAYRGGTLLSTTATGGATVATNLLNVSMGAFLITVAAAAAAVAALYAAYDQFNKLLDVSGGWEGLKAGLGSIANGGSLFEGIDAYQNAKAKEAAAARDGATPTYGDANYDSSSSVVPQVASPTQAIMSSIQTNNSTAEVTVRPAPGAAAAVTKPSKGNIGVRVTPSGGP